MQKRQVMLEKVAEGIKYVAEHVDKQSSFTWFGFYEPKKPVKKSNVSDCKR